MRSRSRRAWWPKPRFRLTLLPQADAHKSVAALAGHEIAGFLIAEAAGGEAHIITIDVAAKYRRAGVGSLLLREMERQLHGRGVRRITLETATSNQAAVAFWQRHGYRYEGVLRGYYLGRLDAYWMVKQLPPVMAPSARSLSRLRRIETRMSLFHAVVLAVVQGLTEFLPVSSSAHLILIPWLLHWPDGGMAFDVALHAGTLFAVILYFLGTWVSLTLNGLGIRYPAAASEQQFRLNQRLFWFLVAGTIPGAVVGLFVRGIHRENAAQSGADCLRADRAGAGDGGGRTRFRGSTGTWNKLTLSDSLIVGSAQALALFPGVSRSGITIVAGLWRNMTREAAARFSFLLATPLIAGAALKEVPELLRLRHTGAIDISLSTIFISIAVSAIVGYAVIAFFLRYLQTRTLKIFVVYRIAFGIVVLLVWFLHRGTAR